jgi:hypothetical protein
VIDALARELESSPPLGDREAFRAMAKRVQQASGAKGKGLFHPIRLALTGEAEGIELDIAVPAIERGALLGRPAEADLSTSAKAAVDAPKREREGGQVGVSGLRRIASARERAAAFATAVRAIG